MNFRETEFHELTPAEKSTATFLVVKSISTKSTHYFGCEDMKVQKSAFRYGREDTTG